MLKKINLKRRTDERQNTQSKNMQQRSDSAHTYTQPIQFALLEHSSTSSAQGACNRRVAHGQRGGGMRELRVFGNLAGKCVCVCVFEKTNGHFSGDRWTHTQALWAIGNDPLSTRICPYPFFEATPPGAAPGPPV